MKALLVSYALCAVIAGFQTQSAPQKVSQETLSGVKGNTACAVAYPTTGGCKACVSAGTVTVTYTYTVNGVPYTVSYNMPVYKSCDTYAVDQKCMTGNTFLSWCSHATTACSGTASLYTDTNCSSMFQPGSSSGVNCGGMNYELATVTADTGLTCTGVTFGLY